MSRRILSIEESRLRVLPGSQRRGNCRLRMIALAALFLSLLTATPPDLRAQRHDRLQEWQRNKKYFDGLRSRGLYSLAETVCHRKLSGQTLDLVTSTRYAVELSRTLAEHSRAATTLADQTELLHQARQAVEQILESHPNHSQRILLESQLAFVTAFEVESLRWRVDLSPYDRPLADLARKTADLLIPKLQRLDQQAGELARSRKQDVLGEKLLPHQVRGLQRAIQLRLGSALLDKARLFPEASSDRADALVKAGEVLRSLAAVSSNDLTMWQSQLAYTTTLRLRKSSAAAWSMINAIHEDNPPAEIQDAMTFEHVELLLDENRYTDAADFLRRYQTETRRLTGPLSFLKARVFLHLSQIATEKNHPDLAAELRKEVHRAIQAATTTGNSYWAARAQNLLADEQSRNTYGAEAGALVREGQSLFAAGKTEAAAQRYGQALTTAQSRKANKAAAEIGYTYGSLLLQQKKFSDAATVFRLVITLHSQGPRAADADLLVAWCLGMEFRDDPTSERREAYMAALELHRTTYTESATAAEAGWMLAQLQEQRLQTTQALKLYVTVPDGHARYPESMIGVARCSETILNRLRRLNKSRAEWEPAIVGLLSPYIRSSTDSKSILTQLNAEFLVRTSRILLTLEQPDFESADGLLQHVLDAVSASADNPKQAEQLTQDVVETATGLRVVSLTGLGETDAATSLVKSTILLDRDRLAGILERLSAVAKLLPQDQKKRVGEIQLAAVELAGLKVQILSDQELDKFGPVIASALEQTEQNSQAVQILRRLLARRPKDTIMRRRVAEMLLETGKPADITAAQLEFRKLEASLKTGSDDWMDARIHVIETAIALKNFGEARKLLKVTRLLYPNLDSDDLKRRLNDASQALASRK
jgi:tetratricopeptide (TPR) repeat protein